MPSCRRSGSVDQREDPVYRPPEHSPRGEIQQVMLLGEEAGRPDQRVGQETLPASGLELMITAIAETERLDLDFVLSA